MKKIHTYLFVSLSIFTLFGCSSKEEIAKPNSLEGSCIIAGEDAPSWACGTYANNENYYAVGSAPISKLGHNFTRTEALANGRSNLAQQIELDVRTKVESYMRSSGIKDAELGEKVVTQVSRQLSDLTLRGSRQVSYWENKGDNSIYLLLSVSKASTKELLSESIKNVQGTLSVGQQQQNALKALENF